MNFLRACVCQGSSIAERTVIFDREYLLDKDYIALKQNRIATCE